MPESLTRQRRPISGVKLHELVQNDDARGSFTEFYRAMWIDGPPSAQFNLVRSNPKTLRGIHVHVRHWDYLVVVQGVMHLCVGDLRTSSSTFGAWDAIVLDSSRPQAAVIPPGVAHGFYFPQSCTHLYGISEYWCPEEEMGCHWADPSLKLGWNVDAQPILSARDSSLGSLKNLLRQLEPYQHAFSHR